MDSNVQRLLNDKLYDRRKQGALELERAIREALAASDHDRIGKIVDQLCNEFAFSVHQPHARNGGLIGLAAASIALGSDEVAPYLKAIVPPVLACFTDQDARVRYYACESMYNIAKVAKGEILIFFNDVFDALCKLAADGELSVKNGAELLDRLIKDIVSESASTYVSVLQASEQAGAPDDAEKGSDASSYEPSTAFSLAKFIPLLQDRIHVINPFTRTFFVSWVTLLDTIPDLELVHYLPAFLGGLFKFLSDPNREVHVATQGALERFLSEIKRIARIKRSLKGSRRPSSDDPTKRPASIGTPSAHSDRSVADEGSAVVDNDSLAPVDSYGGQTEEDWYPGQDVQIDYAKILDILVTFLDPDSEDQIQLTALRWIETFFDICPEDILVFLPQLLSHVLPAMANGADLVRQAANRVNNSLMDRIASLPSDPEQEDAQLQLLRKTNTGGKEPPLINLGPKDAETRALRTPTPSSKIQTSDATDGPVRDEPASQDDTPARPASPEAGRTRDLDYSAAVGALTLHFLNEHEATRVAALAWLIMLHRRAPRKVLALNDGTFPALLTTLSDPAEAVVTRDLQLLSQISKNSEDGYFTSFMVNLLQLFATDRKLLETRGNLIIRQLCVNLSAERIYRTLADCLEKDEDVEFASIMVQNLNNNLITAPELVELRKRLRNVDSKEGQMLFVALFRSWCHNAVATFSLCLLAQAYEQAYNLLQIFAELEMTVSMLIQIDKLVQLLESPVFTYLRLQLLEPERYPHLYKCLYGVLMLLPQSSAFAALKNRLNSVSAIGYLHVPQRPYTSSHVRQKSTEAKFTPANPRPGDLPTRLKPRDEGGIKWVDLLDKFKLVQERSRRQQTRIQATGGEIAGLGGGSALISSGAAGNRASFLLSSDALGGKEKALPDVPQSTSNNPQYGGPGRPASGLSGGYTTKAQHQQQGASSSQAAGGAVGVSAQKTKSGLSHFRFSTGGGSRHKDKDKAKK